MAKKRATKIPARTWTNIDESARSLIMELKLLGASNTMVRELDLKTLRDLRSALLTLFVRADTYHSIRIEQSIGGVKGVELRERRRRR